MPGRVGLGANRLNGLGNTMAVKAGHVLETEVHLAVGVLTERRGAFVESPQHEHRGVVGRSHATLAGHARHGKPFFQKRDHRGKAVGRFQRLGAGPFVKNDAQGRLVFQRHGTRSVE